MPTGVLGSWGKASTPISIEIYGMKLGWIKQASHLAGLPLGPDAAQPQAQPWVEVEVSLAVA